MSDKWTPEPRDKRLMAWVLRMPWRNQNAYESYYEAMRLEYEAAEAEREIVPTRGDAAPDLVKHAADNNAPLWIAPNGTGFVHIGFTLADVRDAQSAMRNAAKKLRGEGYHATADDLDHHANRLDGGAK